MPGWTCPDINKCQNTLAAIEGDIEDLADKFEDDHYRSDMMDISSEIRNIRMNVLEELRNDNSSLRECYTFVQEEKETLDREIERLRDEIAGLEETIRQGR